MKPNIFCTLVLAVLLAEELGHAQTGAMLLTEPEHRGWGPSGSAEWIVSNGIFKPLIWGPYRKPPRSHPCDSWASLVGLRGKVERITFKSRYDAISIEGWVSVPDQPQGTVFLLHGFTDHSTHDVPEVAKWLQANFNVSVVAFDFRMHGWSGQRPPTFGFAEGGDTQGAIDFAEQDASRFPRPFIIHGASLGGVVGNWVAFVDDRIDAAILEKPPATPWAAVEGFVQKDVGKVAQLINDSYGRNVLELGDIRWWKQIANHRPLVLVIMGDKDQYGIGKTETVWLHWHRDALAAKEKFPKETSDQRKWFLTAHGKDHGNLKSWPRLREAEEELLRLCFQERPGDLRQKR